MTKSNSYASHDCLPKILHQHFYEYLQKQQQKAPSKKTTRGTDYGVHRLKNAENFLFMLPKQKRNTHNNQTERHPPHF